MRAPLAALALLALTAGCGSAASPSNRSAPTPGSLESLWRNSGESVSLIPGTSDYSPGKLRISFLVVDPRGRVVAPPHARVWVARSLRAKPFAEVVAQLEPIGIPGVSTGADAKAIYVARVRVPEPGTYYVLARPASGACVSCWSEAGRRPHPSARVRTRPAHPRLPAATATSQL